LIIANECGGYSIVRVCWRPYNDRIGGKIAVRIDFKEDMDMKLYKVVPFMLALVLLTSLGGGALADSEGNISCFPASEVVIDGSLSEWNLSSPAAMNTAGQVVRDLGQWTGPEDMSVEAYLMWDAENLYLAAKILDDTPFMYREGFPPDMADSLVLFLSTDPGADMSRKAYARNDFRLTMVIDDYYYNTGIDRDMVEDNGGFTSAGADGDEQVLDGYECAIEEIEGGYTFEAAIPWRNFANDAIAALVPEAGMTLGVEFGVFDLDFPCPGVATARMQWHGGSVDVDTDPSLWGMLTFCE